MLFLIAASFIYRKRTWSDPDIALLRIYASLTLLLTLLLKMTFPPHRIPLFKEITNIVDLLEKIWFSSLKKTQK